MAYEAPTAAEFLARFPAFEDVDDAAIAGALADAARQVDETWTEGDFKTAQLLYAAHILTLDGQGKGREVKLLGFKSVAIGSALRLERSAGGDAVAGTLASTSFGVRFLELARQNLGGPRVV